MENYRKVKTEEYVKEGLESGRMVPKVAAKFARIDARKGQVGEEIISWSVDSNTGEAVKEKISKVSLDEKTKEPGWVVTKLDLDGTPKFDEHGHLNQWIIEDSVFKKKYEIDPENTSIYKPVGEPQIFVDILDNITLEQWGETMNIAAGGKINVTNINDMYGISERDFNDTYAYVDSDVKKRHVI